MINFIGFYWTRASKGMFLHVFCRLEIYWRIVRHWTFEILSMDGQDGTGRTGRTGRDGTGRDGTDGTTIRSAREWVSEAD